MLLGLGSLWNHMMLSMTSSLFECPAASFNCNAIPTQFWILAAQRPFHFEFDHTRHILGGSLSLGGEPEGQCREPVKGIKSINNCVIKAPTEAMKFVESEVCFLSSISKNIWDRRRLLYPLHGNFLYRVCICRKYLLGLAGHWEAAAMAASMPQGSGTTWQATSMATSLRWSWKGSSLWTKSIKISSSGLHVGVMWWYVTCNVMSCEEVLFCSNLQMYVEVMLSQSVGLWGS